MCFCFFTIIWLTQHIAYFDTCRLFICLTALPTWLLVSVFLTEFIFMSDCVTTNDIDLICICFQTSTVLHIYWQANSYILHLKVAQLQPHKMEVLIVIVFWCDCITLEDPIYLSRSKSVVLPISRMMSGRVWLTRDFQVPRVGEQESETARQVVSMETASSADLHTTPVLHNSRPSGQATVESASIWMWWNGHLCYFYV